MSGGISGGFPGYRRDNSGSGAKQHVADRMKTDKGKRGGAISASNRDNGYRVKVSVGDKTQNDLCPVAKRCGGCQWMGRDYQEQLKEKEKQVRKLLAPYCRLEGILGMEQPLYYRNKVHAVFGEDKKHRLVSGIYEEYTHRIVPVDSCRIENQRADAIIVSIRELLPSFKIRPYNEDTGYGLLRHVLVRTGQVSGQIMVVLVLASPILPSKNNFVKALLKRHPEINTIVVNVNNRSTSMVLGDKEQVIYGKGYIEDTLCGKTFRISPKSFYQVNPAQTEVLYAKAMEYAALTGQETVVDAYCGTGTIGIIASDRAKQVIGVELNADAVRDARSNAKINQARNIQFYQNDAGRFLLEMEAQGARVDVVLMDPPRSGSSEEFLSAVARMAPGKVVYVSCNPETLVRDLKYMVGNGYRVERAVAVDMFPFTGHVETVCLLSKLNVEHHIEVEINLDEMDLTKAESKATYEEIKEYVLEHSGLKVSSLYIAQVKEKCGIIERVNYNLPKSENSRQPKCPLEKEVAIREALGYFQMI